MMRKAILAAGTFLWLGSMVAGATHGTDGLAALEQNPSPQATEQVSQIYHQSKNPDQRLWLMDVLYNRVRQYHDAASLDLLWEAAKDKDPDVRRKAIGDLDSFRFLPEAQAREAWLVRIRAVIKAAEKDPSTVVRSAGDELKLSTQRWETEKEAPVASKPTPRPSSNFQSLSRKVVLQIFVWMVCLQLIGYAWYKIGIDLLIQTGTPGRAVLKTFGAFEKNPLLAIFPLSMTLLVLLFLGVSVGWWLIIATIPVFEIGESWEWDRTYEILAIVYLAAGMSCFLPAAVMAGKLTTGFKASLRRIFSFIILGIWSLVFAWPLEMLFRLARRGKRNEGALSWMVKTGTPFAALLTCSVMVKESLTPWAGLEEAARRFPTADKEAGVEFWGRAPFQPAFFLWCVASPVLLSLSLAPAIKFGFRPTYLFNLRFMSDSQFAIGFGWWSGVLLSVSTLGYLMSSGAVRAAQMARETVGPKRGGVAKS
jgi:hypothetical protein